MQKKKDRKTKADQSEGRQTKEQKSQKKGEWSPSKPQSGSAVEARSQPAPCPERGSGVSACRGSSAGTWLQVEGGGGGGWGSLRESCIGLYYF